MPRHARQLALLAVLLAGLAGCGGAGPRAGGSGKLQVVAAENFWGSIARQVGGPRVEVASIVGNPNADPHDYEPTAADARTLAGARMAIVNGVGYDAWATKLLSANPVDGRAVLDVGKLAGVPAGGNPHRWYSPPDVQRVIAQLSADYQRLDPGHAAYYAQRRRAFEQRGLGEYSRLIDRIRSRYAGVAVGASESIFVPLAQALGLRLLTPDRFLNAISEGTDPAAQDKASVDRQIGGRQIKVWVYNSQNATPDIQRLNAAARRAGIPVVTVTETLTPAGASFQDWQVRELRQLAAALAGGTGR
jgi:zinc/manganese transport system substrate-binding protein